ncbi:methyltransferase [Candidatus Babeliales bacterium]|nr:methyltransferase [Candidatus Babeliales bacterium]
MLKNKILKKSGYFLKKVEDKIKLFCDDSHVLFKCLITNTLTRKKKFNIPLLVKCHRELRSLHEIYQPTTIDIFNHLTPKRACGDRLNLIIKDMNSDFSTINDIGCQIGYFSFSLAEKGANVTGFDMENKNILICNMLKKLQGIEENLNFKKIAFSLENLDHFKKTDYTLCLAVFHHVILYQGIDTAKKLIKDIRNKTIKKLYFEIGQSNEKIDLWSKHLPDMGSDPYYWIENFLKEAGFSQVKILGQVPTHLTDVRRYLISAN